MKRTERTDCIYYFEYFDMGAHIPCCEKHKGLGNCPCEGCKKYTNKKKRRFYLPISPKGKWIHRNDDFNDWLECSKCGYGSEGEVKYGEGTNFCPNCGADMKGDTK